MRTVFLILIFPLVLSFCGCEIISHWQEIKVLNSIGNNEQDISAYVKRQDSLYQRLYSDIKANRITIGTSQNKIIARYGTPILEETVSSEQTRLLYRLSMEYFKTDRIFLYFNKEGKLINWEISRFDQTGVK